MRQGLILVCVIVGLVTSAAPARALAILPHFNSTTSGPDNDPAAGGGNIQAVFAAAASFWERVLLDDRTVTIPFRWVEGSSGLGFSDGTSVFISRDLDWFVDSTPLLGEEYLSTTSGTAVIDGVTLNYHRGLAGGTGAATGYDLFTVMLHEIGHVLSFGPDASAEWADGDVDITAPLPLAGISIPMHPRCCHVDLASGYTGPFPLLFPFIDVEERRFISDADLLFVAESGGWTRVDESLFRTVPEPALLGLLVVGTLGLARRRRTRR